MTESLKEELRRRLQALPSGLQDHIQRMLQESVALGKRFHIERERLELAALAHDLARAMNGQELIARARALAIPLDPVEMAVPVLLHGPVGAEMLRRELGLEDEEILGATRSHTNGSPGMSALAKVIFLADKLDPAKKGMYPFIDRVRTLSAKSLDEALLAFLNEDMAQFLKKGSLVHPDMLAARNHLLMELGRLPTAGERDK